MDRTSGREREDAATDRPDREPVPAACLEQRGAWLDLLVDPTGEARAQGAEDLPPHAAGCPACRRWLRAARAAVASLQGGPAGAPAELDLRVELELEEPALRHARRVGSLSDQAAPAELDAAVEPHLRLAAGPPDLQPRERRSEVVLALRRLARHGAPPVLARLVAEDLADPAHARVERLVGGLSPLVAPERLASRLEASLHPFTRRRLARLVPALTLAAVLLVWIGVRSFRGAGAPEAPHWSFPVEVVHDPALLGSSGSDYLSVLAGGAVGATGSVAEAGR